MSRARSLLSVATLVVGGVLCAEAASTSTSTSSIQHVVVLMLENRSFDHVFGWLKKLNPAIDGLNGDESQPLNCSDPNSQRITVNDLAKWITPDPDHSYNANLMQLFGDAGVVYPPPMNGFVEQAYAHFDQNLTAATTVLSSFAPDDIPTFATLASEFALFQRWYCSVPSSTWPNRLYTHSATSSGEVATSDILRMILGYPQKTLYDLLDEAGLSWLSFFSEIPDQLLFQSARKLENLAKLRPYLEFESYAKAGNLPNFTWIAPKFFEIPCIPADDQHPPHDFSLGELRVKQVYETLRASPQWNSTALIITYDENGGFSDHVPTPMNGVPSPDGINATNPDFGFDRLGVRVPTIVISPWIEKGVLINDPTPAQQPVPGVSQWEHTSIIHTIRRLFNITATTEPLTKRDEWAATFDDLFQVRSTPRTDCPMTLPEPPVSPSFHATGNDVLTDLHRDVIRIAAGAAGQTDDQIPWSTLRTELDGARYVIPLVYETVLKREVPTPLAAALKMNPGHAVAACAAVEKLIEEATQFVDLAGVNVVADDAPIVSTA